MKGFIEWTGFGNGKGQLSFNKMVTFTSLWFFGLSLYAIIHNLRLVPPWYVWSFGFVVVGAGFGLKGYLGAAARRNEMMNVSDATNTNIDVAAITKAVLQRRDPEAGVDPT